MSRLFAVALSALFSFAGVAVAQDDGPMGLQGVFARDRSSEDLRDFHNATDGYDVELRESFPEQFHIGQLTGSQCDGLREVLANKTYLHKLSPCQSTPPRGSGDSAGRDDPPRPDEPRASDRQDAALKHIAFQKTDGGLANYTVGGVLVFDALWFETDEPVSWSRQGNHLVLSAGDDRLSLTDNPTGLVGFSGRGDGSLTFDFANASLEATGDGLRVEGPGFYGFLTGQELERAGDSAVRTEQSAKFHIRPVRDAETHSSDKIKIVDERRVVDKRIVDAIEKRHLGGEISIRKALHGAGAAGDESVVLVYDDVNVTVEQSASDDGPVRVVFDAELESGRTFVLDVDPALFAGEMALRYWDVHDDGSQTEVVFAQASSLEDILNPDDDGGQPEYWLVRDANGIQILVSVPHWSTHAVTIQSIGEFLIQPSVLVGAAAGVMGVAIAAIGMFWPRRRAD